LRYDRDSIDRHTKAELNAAALAARGGGLDEAETLRAMMRPYVVKMMQRLDGLGGDGYTRDMSDDLKQTVWAAVWIALPKFCDQPHGKGKTRVSCPGIGEPHPDDGTPTKFSSYAHFWMRHEAQEWMAKNSRALPVPRVAWAQALRLEEAFAYEFGEDADPTEAADDVLAALVISDPKGKGDRTVEHAGDIMRAKTNSYALDDDYDGQGNSEAAEDEFMEVVHDMDTDALETMAALEGLMAEGRQDDAIEVVSQFVDRHGLPWKVAASMLREVAA
jgi:hypothetical protein